MYDSQDMTERRDGLADYRIRVKEHLELRWATRFEGMHLSHEQDGTTTLSGRSMDQAALHGVLRTVRDAGLSLIAVVQGASLAGQPLGVGLDLNQPDR